MKAFPIVMITALVALYFLATSAAIRNGDKKGEESVKFALWKKFGSKSGNLNVTKLLKYCYPHFNSEDDTSSQLKEFATCAVTFKIPLESFESSLGASSSSDSAAVTEKIKRHGLNFFDNQLEASEEFKKIKDSYTNIGKDGFESHRHRMPLPPAIMHKVLDFPCFGECLMKTGGMLSSDGNINQTYFDERFVAISKGKMPQNATDLIIDYCSTKVSSQAALKPTESADPATDACWVNTRVGLCISKFSWEVCQYFALEDAMAEEAA